MSEENEGMLIYMGNDGVFREYDQRNDIVIHCDSEEDRKYLMNKLEKGLNIGWIPCSERLPDFMSNDKPNDVLVCVRVTEMYMGCNKKQAIYYGRAVGCYYDEKWWITYVYGCKRISEINEEYKNCHYEVIAWMPLPEPYKENDNERP